MAGEEAPRAQSGGVGSYGLRSSTAGAAAQAVARTAVAPVAPAGGPTAGGDDRAQVDCMDVKPGGGLAGDDASGAQDGAEGEEMGGYDDSSWPEEGMEAGDGGEDYGGEDDPVADEAGPAPATKRDYARWSPEEEAVYYATLRDVAGQKPELCLKEVTRRLGGSKDYSQVRHYYYRLIKRLNKILGSDTKLDVKNPLQVHRAMIKFWEVVVKQGMNGTYLVSIGKKPRKQRELSNSVQRDVKAIISKPGLATAAGSVARGSSKAAAKGVAAKSAAGSSNTAAGAAANGGRKRKPRSAPAAAAGAPAEGGAGAAGQAEAAVGAASGEAGAAAGAASGQDVEMADAEAPPAKQARRSGGPNTRRQHALLTVAAVAHMAADSAGQPEGSSHSETGAHEAPVDAEHAAQSSHTVGSQPDGNAAPGGRTLGSSGGGAGGGSHSFRSSSGMGPSGTAPEGSMSQAAGSKLRLQLMPWDGATTAAMAAAGYHPFLELTLSSSKSLLSVLRHLCSKWHQATPAGGSGGSGGPALYVHPPTDCPITLRGMSWGGPDCDSQLKVGDIHTTLHCPSPFQLLYSWNRPAVAAVAAPAPPAPATAAKPTRPSSSRATSQQRQQQSARKDELAAVLKEALSAVAAAPVKEEPPVGAEPFQQQLALGQQHAQPPQAWEQQEQQQEQGWVQQGAQPPSFMELMGQDTLLPDAPPAAAALSLPAAGFGQQQGATCLAGTQQVLPTANHDQQLPAGMAAAQSPCIPHAGQPAAVPSAMGACIAQAQAHMAPAAGGLACSGTPAMGRPGVGSPPSAGQAALGQQDAQAPPTDPRKPRGLLGLLQTPAEKAAPAADKSGTGGSTAKASRSRRQAQPCKTPASSRGTAKAGGARQKKGAAAAAAAVAAQQQQYGNLPLPAGFMWAHMHPHLQQPGLQAQQQAQQQQPVLQPALQMPLLQEQQHQPPLLQPAQAPAALAGAGGGALEVGNDTLLHFLDATAGATAAGFPSGLGLFGSPPLDAEPADGAMISDDFSLKSWPSLSPPSNFQLPDGFDPGLSPAPRKGLAGPAGTMTGGGSGAKAASGAPGGALDAMLGPTDFSLLLAGVAGSGGPVASSGLLTKPQAAAEFAQQPQQQEQQQEQQHASGMAHQAADALFGGGMTTMFGFLGGTGATCQAAPDLARQAAAGAGAAGPPLRPEKEAVESLTFDFGSLLGVGDAAPSWLGPAVQQQPGQQQQQHTGGQHQQPKQLGDRPFAALFGK